MTKINYCSRCVFPSTKPYIFFDEEGVCGACRSSEKKRKFEGGIDWKHREKQFESLILQAKAQQAPFYDVMVPVSGGKDSITQV